MDRASRVITTGVILTLLALSGASIADAIIQVNDEAESKSNVKVALSGDDLVEVDDSSFGRGSGETVVDSRGFGLLFTGADDSRVEFNSDATFYTDKNWTVMQGVIGVNDSATERNMTILALGDPVNLYIRYSNVSGMANFSAVIMDPGDSYIANVTVDNPTDTTVLFVTRNHHNVSIYANETKGESVDTSVENDISQDLTNDSNFHGTLDETRTFDSVVDAANRSALVSDAVQPLPGNARTARLMYDAGSGTAISVYWSSTDATGFNISYVPGFAGHVLTRSSGPPGADYEWRITGPKIRPIEGGRIDGAPVAWASYNFVDQLTQFLHGYTSFTSMIEIFLVVMMATAIVVAAFRIRTMK